VIERHGGAPGKPAVVYRFAGDQAVLAEYGPNELDLTLNFFALAVERVVAARAVEGVTEAAPGFRSLLVRYDPLAIPCEGVVAELHAAYAELPASTRMVVPSRCVSLPVAFDDSQTRAAVERYAQTIRGDAPNCETGSNVDYAVRYNGMANREELYATALGGEHWNAFTGFFPGLPFMFPLDPRHIVVTPKYNPTRTWTPEAAFALGGPCFTIYPVESPGGYQLLGRTLPIYDIEARNSAFAASPLLLRAGDRVRFRQVDESELLELWEDVRHDRYRYEIVETDFDVGAYLEWLPTVAGEAAEQRRQRERAAASTPIP
jgi:allophanate hydrolase subunit 1